MDCRDSTPLCHRILEGHGRREMTGDFIMRQTDPTPYAEINQLLELLLSGIQKILGEKLVGLYLYGSLVSGDFDNGSSVIDLIAALYSDIDDRDFTHLYIMHIDIYTKLN